MRYLYLFTAIILTIHFQSSSTFAQQNYPQKFLIKVYLDSQDEIEKFRKLPLDFASHKIKNYAEVVVGPEELMELVSKGYNTEIIPDFNANPEVREYPSYEEVTEKLQTIAINYPQIVKLFTIGYSQRLKLPIYAVKVSDNVMEEEDEPSILFDGMHHAREPVGMLCTLAILDYLLNNYGLNSQVNEWVDNTEIFIIPMINPEGWQYLYNNNLGDPFWRKNLHENNGNSIFQPAVDGVDLNRNYNFNFRLGGSDNMTSWTYRGVAGFSESETRAKRDLTFQQKFVASVTYHSYGEIIMFPWNEFPRPGDFDLLEKIAGDMANLIPSLDGQNSYEAVRSGCEVGQSQCWMVGKGGVLEVLVETGNIFIPNRYIGNKIAMENLNAALYLLNRINGPGLKGIITDAVTGKPVEAVVKILEIDNGSSADRSSDPIFGRYYRLLERGTYSIEISSPGYDTKIVSSVLVNQSKLENLDVQLDPVGTYSEEISLDEFDLWNGTINIFPNPFSSKTQLSINCKKAGKHELRIYNQLGQLVSVIFDGYLPIGIQRFEWDGTDNSDRKLPKGLYIYNLIGPENNTSGRIIKK